MIKVFLVCSGLGNVKRGFESFTQECFEALSQEPSLDITLLKGGGESGDKSITLWNLPRDTSLAIILGNLLGRGSYFIEQTSFALSLLPQIQKVKPDVIYFSDGNLGNILWHWRRLTKQNYKLLFSNGGPLPPPFERWDFVQQVAPSHCQVALDTGEFVAKQSMVPYGIHIPVELKILSIAERKSLRCKLGLPEEPPIILSVGAVNKSHKRMDYVIREMATLSEPRPYLLLLGQQEVESPEICQLGNRLLGGEDFQIRTVAPNEVANYYKVADAFVLASLREGFGRVFLEAMSYGLPCLAHDYEIPQFILGKDGYLANFELQGSLASLIRQVLAEGNEECKRRLRHLSVYKRFSWETLRTNYVEMIRHCVLGEKQCDHFNIQ